MHFQVRQPYWGNTVLISCTWLIRRTCPMPPYHTDTGGPAGRHWTSWIRRGLAWGCWTVPITACHAVSNRSAPNFSRWSSLKKTICVSCPSFAGCRIPCLIFISWMPLPVWASWTRWFIITGRTPSPSATGTTLPSRNIY